MSLICIAIVAMFVASDAARKNPSLFTSVSERGSKTDKCTGKKKQKKKKNAVDMFAHRLRIYKHSEKNARHLIFIVHHRVDDGDWGVVIRDA